MVTDVEMSDSQAVLEISEETTPPEITEVEAAGTEGDVLVAACELIEAAVC